MPSKIMKQSKSISKIFRLPDLGEGVHEAMILRVMVVEGDKVREDGPLFEVETDKASVTVPSPHAGLIEKVHINAQQVVYVGDPMVTIIVADQVADAEPPGQSPEAKPVKAAKAAAPSNASPPTPASPAKQQQPAAHSRIRPPAQKAASPAVRQLARKLNVDLEQLEGTGPGGRVTQADVERAAGDTHRAIDEEPEIDETAENDGDLSETQTLAPPPKGRSASSGHGAPSTAPAGGPIAQGTPDNDSWGPIIRTPINRTRKAIAYAMVKSVSSIPHVTDTDDVDITDLDRLRRGYEMPDQPGGKITVLPFVIRAAAMALGKFPDFNASYDEERDEIIYHQYISISVGVHTDRGLIAPVLRNVDRMSVAQIAGELAVLSENARSARFQVNDTRGGTFTVSNAGAMGGSKYSTPIINYPQSAVLALGRSRWQPWIVDEKVVARFILPLSLSFDHRIIDGGQSIPFMQDIISSLQNPARMLL